MSSAPVSRRGQRFLRLSVRGLIVVVLLIGAGLGWMVRVLRTAQLQRDAVTAIKSARGAVAYDGILWDGQEPKEWVPRSRRWLRDHIGVDYFAQFTHVYFGFSSSTAIDAAVGQASHLTRVRVMDLGRSSVSDAGLAHLKELTDLCILSVGGTRVTDAGLVHLKGLTKLSWLSLAETQVTDAGLAHLEGLTELRVLTLQGTQVTDAGVNELKRANPRLFVLRLIKGLGLRV
jgi:hypothetical protein